VNAVVVVDASALAAVVFCEAGSERIAERLEGVTLCAPSLLKFELANAAVTKARRQPKTAPKIFAALAIAIDDRADIVWHDVPSTDVALMAQATGLSAYDASYLWLAGFLDAELVTLDKKLAAALEA
jgi:predicted nucleic acid-binding protein